VRARNALLIGLVAASVVTSGCSGGGSSGAGKVLVGTFRLDAGSCTTATALPTGSYLEVIDAADAKEVSNPQSTCANRDFTLLTPGTDGGVVTGKFQPNPTPTFDGHGNSLAGAIVAPALFQGVKLGMATDADDEQDGPSGPPAFAPPSAVLSGSTLNLDLRSLNVTYGGSPGTTCATASGVGCWNLGSKGASGTYDASTRHFSVGWFVGETFTPAGDSLTVHLEGTFVPAGGSS
jgi:hypothetical protein